MAMPVTTAALAAPLEPGPGSPGSPPRSPPPEPLRLRTASQAANSVANHTVPQTLQASLAPPPGQHWALATATESEYVAAAQGLQACEAQLAAALQTHSEMNTLLANAKQTTLDMEVKTQQWQTEVTRCLLKRADAKARAKAAFEHHHNGIVADRTDALAKLHAATRPAAPSKL